MQIYLLANPLHDLLPLELEPSLGTRLGAVAVSLKNFRACRKCAMFSLCLCLWMFPSFIDQLTREFVSFFILATRSLLSHRPQVSHTPRPDFCGSTTGTAHGPFGPS